MASSKHFFMVGLAAILIPAIAMAADYVVGDDKGWTTNFDYESWAKDKTFYVGDTLVFKYTPPNHNVYKVDGAGFKDCNVAENAEALTSGNDRVDLKTAGQKWYICGKPNHCNSGQKLSINVMETSSYSSSSPVSVVFGYRVFVSVLVVVLLVKVNIV